MLDSSCYTSFRPGGTDDDETKKSDDLRVSLLVRDAVHSLSLMSGRDNGDGRHSHCGRQDILGIRPQYFVARVPRRRVAVPSLSHHEEGSHQYPHRLVGSCAADRISDSANVLMAAAGVHSPRTAAPRSSSSPAAISVVCAGGVHHALPLAVSCIQKFLLSCKPATTATSSTRGVHSVTAVNQLGSDPVKISSATAVLSDGLSLLSMLGDPLVGASCSVSSGHDVVLKVAYNRFIGFTPRGHHSQASASSFASASASAWYLNPCLAHVLLIPLHLVYDLCSNDEEDARYYYSEEDKHPHLDLDSDGDDNDISSSSSSPAAVAVILMKRLHATYASQCFPPESFPSRTTEWVHFESMLQSVCGGYQELMFSWLRRLLILMLFQEVVFVSDAEVRPVTTMHGAMLDVLARLMTLEELIAPSSSFPFSEQSNNNNIISGFYSTHSHNTSAALQQGRRDHSSSHRWHSFITAHLPTAESPVDRTRRVVVTLHDELYVTLMEDIVCQCNHLIQSILCPAAVSSSAPPQNGPPERRDTIGGGGGVVRGGGGAAEKKKKTKTMQEESSSPVFQVVLTGAIRLLPHHQQPHNYMNEIVSNDESVLRVFSAAKTSFSDKMRLGGGPKHNATTSTKTLPLQEDTMGAASLGSCSSSESGASVRLLLCNVASDMANALAVRTLVSTSTSSQKKMKVEGGDDHDRRLNGAVVDTFYANRLSSEIQCHAAIREEAALLHCNFTLLESYVRFLLADDDVTSARQQQQQQRSASSKMETSCRGLVSELVYVQQRLQDASPSPMMPEQQRQVHPRNKSASSKHALSVDVSQRILNLRGRLETAASTSVSRTASDNDTPVDVTMARLNHPSTDGERRRMRSGEGQDAAAPPPLGDYWALRLRVPHTSSGSLLFAYDVSLGAPLCPTPIPPRVVTSPIRGSNNRPLISSGGENNSGGVMQRVPPPPPQPSRLLDALDSVLRAELHQAIGIAPSDPAVVRVYREECARLQSSAVRSIETNERLTFQDVQSLFASIGAGWNVIHAYVVPDDDEDNVVEAAAASSSQDGRSAVLLAQYSACIGGRLIMADNRPRFVAALSAQAFCAEFFPLVAKSKLILDLKSAHAQRRQQQQGAGVDDQDVSDRELLEALCDALEFPLQSTSIVAPSSPQSGGSGEEEQSSSFTIYFTAPGVRHVEHLRSAASALIRHSMIEAMSGVTTAGGGGDEEEAKDPTDEKGGAVGRAAQLQQQPHRSSVNKNPTTSFTAANGKRRPTSTTSTNKQQQDSSAAASYYRLRFTPHKQFVDSNTVQQLQRRQHELSSSSCPLFPDDDENRYRDEDNVVYRWHVDPAQEALIAAKVEEDKRRQQVREDPNQPPWRREAVTPIQEKVRLTRAATARMAKTTTTTTTAAADLQRNSYSAIERKEVPFKVLKDDLSRPLPNSPTRRTFRGDGTLDSTKRSAVSPKGRVGIPSSSLSSSRRRTPTSTASPLRYVADRSSLNVSTITAGSSSSSHPTTLRRAAPESERQQQKQRPPPPSPHSSTTLPKQRDNDSAPRPHHHPSTARPGEFREHDLRSLIAMRL